MKEIEINPKSDKNIDEEKQQSIVKSDVVDSNSISESDMKIIIYKGIPYLATKYNKKMWYLKFSQSM